MIKSPTPHPPPPTSIPRFPSCYRWAAYLGRAEPVPNAKINCLYVLWFGLQCSPSKPWRNDLLRIWVWIPSKRSYVMILFSSNLLGATLAAPLSFIGDNSINSIYTFSINIVPLYAVMIIPVCQQVMSLSMESSPFMIDLTSSLCVEICTPMFTLSTWKRWFTLSTKWTPGKIFWTE